MSQREGKKKALAETRKRFLVMTSTTLGAALTGCGYGFVAPTNRAPDGSARLVLSMDSGQQKILSFFRSLQTNTAVQNNFLMDPTSTMVALGAIPERTSIEIDRANRLLFYTFANFDLQEKLRGAVLRSPSLSEIGNRYTTTNVNIQTLDAMQRDFESSPDWQQAFDDQIHIFVADGKVRELLGIKLADADVPAFAKHLSGSLKASASARESGVTPQVAVLVANVLYVANVNFKWNANVNQSANGNINANWNLNANWNINTNCAGVDEPNAGPYDVHAWESFLLELMKHAEHIRAQSIS